MYTVHYTLYTVQILNELDERTNKTQSRISEQKINRFPPTTPLTPSPTPLSKFSYPLHKALAPKPH